jgi:hypothetical protein
MDGIREIGQNASSFSETCPATDEIFALRNNVDIKALLSY